MPVSAKFADWLTNARAPFFPLAFQFGSSQFLIRLPVKLPPPPHRQVVPRERPVRQPDRRDALELPLHPPLEPRARRHAVRDVQRVRPARKLLIRPRRPRPRRTRGRGDRIPCSSTSSSRFTLHSPTCTSVSPRHLSRHRRSQSPASTSSGDLGQHSIKTRSACSSRHDASRSHSRISSTYATPKNLATPLANCLRYAPRRMRVVRHDVHTFLTQQRRPVPGPGAHLDHRPVQTGDGSASPLRTARRTRNEWGSTQDTSSSNATHRGFATTPPHTGTNRAGGDDATSFFSRSPPETYQIRAQSATDGVLSGGEVQALRHAPREELVAYLGVQRGVHVAVRVERPDAQRFTDTGVRRGFVLAVRYVR